MDAESIDVYKHCNGVIFIFDLSKPSSIDYVVKQLRNVPTQLPVLVIGNFSDKITSDPDDAFLKQRFQSIRNSGDEDAPLHYISGSLLDDDNDLVKSVFKFFDLPFLHLQRLILNTKLKVNEEQIVKASAEWFNTTSDLRSNDSFMETVNISNDKVNVVANLELLSTDTLTMTSRQAWSEPVTPLAEVVNKNHW